MKFCPNCGHEVKPTDNVCGNCGHRLTPSRPTAAQVPPEQIVEPSSQQVEPAPRRRAQQKAAKVKKQKPKQKPNKKSSGTFFKVFIGLCILALLGEGGYLLYEHFNDNSTQTVQSDNNASQSSSSANSSARHDNHDSDTTSSNAQTSNSSDSTSNSSDDWNSSKQAKFDDFFDNWADGMDQDYTKVNTDGTFKAGPAEYPAAFDKFDVDGEPVTIGMSKDGRGNKDYNVVAVYNHGNYEFHITYFFTFHNGKPVVLVDQTTNGDRIKAKVTDNQKLREGFARIAAGD
ncbi:DUF4767 domain-containing protein [Lactobacillus rodentium]|uniref:Zinc-ribbon domain-containing protein n=1 Tax=Lactobacillus rodentium TaxID=947835 RepID=A0A2Z6TE51_9LACO|nr:DUF4767 domain-containing protein [Lactobacillus rodentium]MCR1894134.1 DUF4767 domain-containing protein [Lactobacillus rodentium]GBG04430.1 hypothetical protein LrDSM24759_03440 [Lactobacillus rodentium]